MKQKVVYIFFILFTVCVLPKIGFAQQIEEFEVDRKGPEDEEEEPEEEKPDIKPYIGKWKISENGVFLYSTKIDTILDTY